MILYLIGCIIITFIYYFFTRTFGYWRQRNIKGPKPIPLFGNYKDIALRKKSTALFYNELYKQYPEEKVIGLYRMTKPTLLIRDLEIVKQVMIKDFLSFSDRGISYSKEGFGDNMFHAELKTWKMLRQNFSLIFSPNKLKNLLPVFVDHGKEFCKYVADISAMEPEQDIYPMVLNYTAGSAMAATLGLDISAFDKKTLFDLTDKTLWTTHLNELDMLLPGIMVKFNWSILRKKTINFFNELTTMTLNQLPVVKTSPSNAMEVIKKLKLKQEQGNENLSSSKTTKALLASQAWTFYSTGYANNALILTHTLYHLARNPDVQDKLIKEIEKVMEKYEHKLTYEAIKELKYIDLIFEEILRLHPITNGLTRNATRNVKLDGLNLTVEAGTVVVVSAYAIHHDEKYYPEPERFIPERFLPENVQNRNPLSFISFGVGPRSCIGPQLGRLQFAVGLALIFSKFRVEPTEKTVREIKYDPWRLLMTPQDKIILKIIPK